MDFERAADTLFLRQTQDSLLKRHMIEVRNRYNGDLVIPLTEVPDEPTIEPPVPMLVADAIDNTTNQACSTRPEIFVPSLDPEATNHRQRAERTRDFYYAMWYESKMPLITRRFVRHLCGYGVNSVVVVPNFKDNYPKVVVRDPLTAYPDEMAPEEYRAPINIGWIYPRSAAWIHQTYPEAKQWLKEQSHSDLWDVFEWMDEDMIYIGILGPRQLYGQSYSQWTSGGRGPFKLREWPNRAGMVPVSCPGRVTLDRVAGMVSKQIGMIDMYSKIMALEAVAAEKAVFADTYILADQDGTVRLVNGDWKDGRTGEVNTISGARAVGQLVNAINPGTFQVADRYERGVRMSSGQPGIFGGELTGAIRSGQTIAQAGAYSVDPRVQEVQELMEYQLQTINKGIFHVAKGYWPDKKYVLFSGWPSARGLVQTTPAKDFEYDCNVVAYAFAGADINTLGVAIAQAMQARVIDRKTAMRKHPLVDNPEDVERQIIVEAFTDATLSSILARAQNGEIAEVQIAAIVKHYLAEGDLFKAYELAQAEIQQQQATMAPPPEAGQIAAPETMPGLATPGMAGVEQPAPGPPPSGAAGFAELLAAMTGGQNAA